MKEDITLIVFDFDGTLGDTRRNIVTTMQMTIAEMGLPERNESECASTIGLPLAGCFGALFPNLTSDMLQRCADTYRRIFSENLKHIRPKAFPNVVQTLAALKQQGLELTIASSRSHASLVELTHDLGMADYMAYLVGADDVVKAKPEPEPVLCTIEAMNRKSNAHYEAAKTLVVGDMDVDILMGRRAGARTCGVTWGNGSREALLQAGADYIIDNMEDLALLSKAGHE